MTLKIQILPTRRQTTIPQHLPPSPPFAWASLLEGEHPVAPILPSRVRSTPSLFAYNCCSLVCSVVVRFCFYAFIASLLHCLSDFAFILPYIQCEYVCVVPLLIEAVYLPNKDHSKLNLYCIFISLIWLSRLSTRLVTLTVCFLCFRFIVIIGIFLGGDPICLSLFYASRAIAYCLYYILFLKWKYSMKLNLMR